MSATANLILFLIMAALVGAFFYFRRVGRRDGIGTWQAIRTRWRQDLEHGPLTVGRINFIYRSLMKRTGKKGPAGTVMPVREITVEMPEEDYLFMEQYGIDAFAAQLREYRHSVALSLNWYPDGVNPVPVRIRRNNALRRLRPKVVYQTSHDGLTHVITSGGGRTRRVDTEELRGTAGATEAFDQPAAGAARLRLGDQEWSLRPSLSPYRFGRAGDNDIHVSHEEVSSHHAEITYAGDGWSVVPLKTTNRTKVNGKAIEAATELTAGDAITVATFGPMVFEEG